MDRIVKLPEEVAGANMRDYDEVARAFSWDAARRMLDGLAGGRLHRP